MRAKNKFMTFGLVFLLVINLTALLTLAHNRLFFEDKSSGNSGKAVKAVQKELQLTSQQARKMIERRNSFKEQIKTDALEIREKKRLLLEEIRTAEPDLGRINRMIDEISLLQAEIQKKAVKNLIKEKSILNENQQKHYFSMCEQHVCGHEPGHSHFQKKSSPVKEKMKNNEIPSCMNNILFH